MTIVSIGGVLLPLAHVSEEWVRAALAECGRWGESFCVRVDIAHRDIQLSLATPRCLVIPHHREHNDRERRIIEAWEKRGLHTGRVEAEELVAFLQELEGLLGIRS